MFRAAGWETVNEGDRRQALEPPYPVGLRRLSSIPIPSLLGGQLRVTDPADQPLQSSLRPVLPLATGSPSTQSNTDSAIPPVVYVPFLLDHSKAACKPEVFHPTTMNYLISSSPSSYTALFLCSLAAAKFMTRVISVNPLPYSPCTHSPLHLLLSRSQQPLYLLLKVWSVNSI